LAILFVVADGGGTVRRLEREFDAKASF